MKTVNLLGVRINCIDKPALLTAVQQFLASPAARPWQISYINAHCLNVAAADPAYRGVLNQAALVYADGIGPVWASRFLGGCRLQKLTGADWIDDFCARAEELGWRVFVLAGAPGVAGRAQANLLKKYPRLNLVGTASGFFEVQDEPALLQSIRAAAPEVLFVGLGVPQQEFWLAAHAAETSARVVWAVGALFDYVAGVEPRCPTWLRALALEWFWRLLIDPRGKFTRYLLGNPLFIYRILKQKFFPPIGPPPPTS